ncbi:MAG TPA: PrgI family protein [Candidatus Paceibacterota bacterium]
MVYKVPQFIEVEDKIFGPLTFKQFLYLAGGAGACFILWTFLPKFIAILLILPVGAFALALSFYRVNNRPFVVLVESFLRWQLSGRLYLWQHPTPPTASRGASPTASPNKSRSQIVVPRLNQGRLKELAWSLDVNENVNS